MSDYISKSKAVESLKKYKFGAIGNDEEREYTKEMVLVIVNGQPTISETEIIRKAFERVVDRLEEKKEYYRKKWNANFEDEDCDSFFAYEKAIKIVKEECGINEPT